MDCEVTESEVTGTQNIEKKLVSIEERSQIIRDKGLCDGETFKDLGAENGESELVNVKIKQSFDKLDVPSPNKLTNPGYVGTLPVIDGGGQLQTHLQKNVNDDDSGHLNNEGRRSSGQSQKSRAKSNVPVTTSWSLRRKSQEKPKVPEPNDVNGAAIGGEKKSMRTKTEKPKMPEPIDTVNDAAISGEKKRSGRKQEKPKVPEPRDTMNDATISGEKKKRKRKQKQQQQQKNTVNEFSKAKSHLKYLLHRITYEQNLIDAYSAEGWKGQSLEKLKPEKELQRAKSHILHYKMKIRALFQRLDQSLAVGKLPEALFDSEGEIDSEDIFCAKCGTKDLTLDNDVILCDGACERGFHQFCLEPPLLKEDIPPGDEGWLCPGCDCKVDCLDMLKDFQGSTIMITDSWEKIFPEAGADASGMKLGDGSEHISDDSEDDDYDPDKHKRAEEIDGDKPSPDESSYFSAPDDSAASLNNEKYLGLPSDDSEDDDFDPSAAGEKKHEQMMQDSSSSDFTSDSEDLGALFEDEETHGDDLDQVSSAADLGQPTVDDKGRNSVVGRKKTLTLKDELLYLTETTVESVSCKRRVERLDYKKLNDETFGNSSSDSSDEDFDGSTSCDDAPSRRRRNTGRTTPRVKFDTAVVESTINGNDENKEERKQLPIQSGRKDADGDLSGSSTRVGSASRGSKSSAPKRLGEAATQTLYASFNKNQYPDRATKESLAQELKLSVEKVVKWFDNARWSFRHRLEMEKNRTKKPPEAQHMEEEPTLSQAVEKISAAKTNEENCAKNLTPAMKLRKHKMCLVDIHQPHTVPEEIQTAANESLNRG